MCGPILGRLLGIARPQENGNPPRVTRWRSSHSVRSIRRVRFVRLRQVCDLVHSVMGGGALPLRVFSRTTRRPRMRRMKNESMN